MPGSKSVLALASFLAIAAALGACAGGPRATDASAAIGAANEAVAHARADNGLAAAPGVLVEAEQRLSQAETAAKSGDNATAIRLATEAKADADLADATAQAAQARDAALAAAPGVGTSTIVPNR